jgi:hypothetical protein
MMQGKDREECYRDLFQGTITILEEEHGKLLLG